MGAQHTPRPGPGLLLINALSLGWTSLPRLPRLRPPTLILAGDDDPIIPVINARIMHRLIPRSKLHIYHGGHLELAADPDAWPRRCRRSSTPTSPQRRASHDAGDERAPRDRQILLLCPRAVHRRAMGALHRRPAVRRRRGRAGRRPVLVERAEICWPLVKRLPELGIVGENIKGYGCAGMSPMACGLVTMELHRGDGSLGVFLGVHAGLAMLSIAMCGSEEQKERWLPAMAVMDKLGAFAVTEPEHGWNWLPWKRWPARTVTAGC